MKEEIEKLREDLAEASEFRQGGFTFYEGKLEGKPVVLVQSGIGKVNAAICTQLLLQQGVSRVIFTGVAGAVAPELKVGDIVVSTDTLQHDIDVTALGYALGEIPGEMPVWEADEALRELALAAARKLEGVSVVAGRIVSGDQFIASPTKVAWLRETSGAVCTEMEGASTAQVCAKWQTPFVIIRSISDTANQDAGMDFREFTKLAAARAGQVVRGMLQGL